MAEAVVEMRVEDLERLQELEEDNQKLWQGIASANANVNILGAQVEALQAEVAELTKVATFAVGSLLKHLDAHAQLQPLPEPAPVPQDASGAPKPALILQP